MCPPGLGCPGLCYSFFRVLLASSFVPEGTQCTTKEPESLGAVSPGLWPRWALEAPAGSLSQAQAGWHSALAALLKTGVGRGGGGAGRGGVVVREQA